MTRSFRVSPDRHAKTDPRGTRFLTGLLALVLISIVAPAVRGLGVAAHEVGDTVVT